MLTLSRFFIYLCIIYSNTVTAEPLIKPFVSGSYQQIVQENTGKGFMLIIWSLDCSSCIKDMEILSALHKTRPTLKMIMLSTDEPDQSQDIAKLLVKYQLADLDNWVFADDNSQKLRYQIDPSWYSELPRTYFFSASHQREGFSGALKADEYNERLKRLGIEG